MENLAIKEMERLPKEKLIELIKMYSRNWMTLDGLWFSGVEEKFGLDAATEIDIQMWKVGSLIEAKRIQGLFKLGGGLENIMKAICFMSWAPCFGYEYDLSKDRAVWTCRRCPPQEHRVRAGKGEFKCRPTFEACFKNVIQVMDPSVRVRCLFCPPDPHPDDAWCRWEFSLPDGERQLDRRP